MPELLAIYAAEAAVTAVVAAEVTPGVAALATAVPTAAGIAGSIASAAAPTLIALAASTAISYGISLLSKPDANAQNQNTIRQPLPSRFVLLGRVKTAGTLFFYDSAGGEPSYLFVGKVVACHQVNLFEQQWLGEGLISLSLLTSGTPIDGAGLVFMGNIDCSDNPNYPAAVLGDAYRVIDSGFTSPDMRIGGTAGMGVEADDSLTCIKSTVGGTQIAVGQNWNHFRASLGTHVYVETGLGPPNQVAAALLTTTFGDSFWSSAHRLRGLAYVVIRYQDDESADGTFAKVYPSGPPEYRALIQGRLVFDPRDPNQDINNELTWKYSDNAALVLAWYLMHEDGWGLGAGVIDITNLMVEASACDELVLTPVQGVEKRYRCWGRYDLTEQRKSVLAELLLCCAGRIQMQHDGKIRITVGRSLPTTVTLDEDVILRVENFVDGPDPTERVGTINPRIVWEAVQWQNYDVPSVSAVVYNSDDRFGSNILDLPLRFCPSPYQAQRIASKIIDEKNSGWRGTLRCTLAALAAYGEWTVRVVITEVGIDGIFEVLNISLDPRDMTVVLSVREMTPTVWDWDGSSGTPAIPTG